jgi:hypothetical protein
MEAVLEVVDVEGPVHEERLHEVLRDVWNVARNSASVRGAIDSAARTLAGRDQLTYRRPFYWMPDTEIAAVRGPDEFELASRRKVRWVPPEELDLALRLAVEDVGHVDVGELKVFIARAFGWNRTGSEISAALDAALERLFEDGTFVEPE